MGRVPGGDLSELVPKEPLELGQARLQGSSKDQRERGLGLKSSSTSLNKNKQQLSGHGTGAPMCNPEFSSYPEGLPEPSLGIREFRSNPRLDHPLLIRA